MSARCVLFALLLPFVQHTDYDVVCVHTIFGHAKSWIPTMEVQCQFHMIGPRVWSVGSNEGIYYH